MIGRPVEKLSVGADTMPVISEIYHPGLSPDSLLNEIEAARSGVRAAFERVVDAKQIGALQA